LEPFSDDASDTSTTIEFEEDPLSPLKGEEDEDSDDITVIVGHEPEKANLDEGGALEPYDPKLDLENYKYPTIDLLDHHKTENVGIDMEEQQQNKDRIIRVLQDFGVKISSIKATVGPTITLYEITPAPGVRISKIRNLEDDIALSLSALGIRIIAPIPGKGTIGIEVPNAKPQIVSMESILNSKKFQETTMELPMALGKTITNEVFMADLTKMPHLLVAGATGQGKSVGLNAIITSLLYKKHPAELKFVMVDPKKVEFPIYTPIVNHFLAQIEDDTEDEPIITDVQKVINTLKSLCVEMDTRYDLLKKARARNIKEYNEKFRNRQLNPEHGHKFLPYIVVIIDEFGDLIMTAGKEIELPIARIAQLARAVGMHMIIATQRPTTNIITGTIKANFPARMAFKVSAMIDSRTILDRPGANQLIGKGDMLFLAGSEPVRLQCAFVDTPEVERIANFIACQQSYSGPFALPRPPMEDTGGGAADVDMNHLDPMFADAARLIVSSQQGSTSMIQRKFSIGYNRAGRLMDQLEHAGVVGPAQGAKPRDVLIQDEASLEFLLNNLG
jgi:S-DNA-T family DNA segregation ATPase FtsK/SpoIIIE